MVEQAHVVELLVNRIGQQIATAQTQEERNQAAKAGLDVLDHLSDERVQDKMESVKKNQDLLDRVHISPEAQELYDKLAYAEPVALQQAANRRPPEEPQIPTRAVESLEPES